MPDAPRECFALLPSGPDPWIRIPKPSESRVKKFICGRGLPAAALSVEGPTKNKLRRTVMLGTHPPEPMINQRGFPDTSPGNNRNDVDILVRPCGIQVSNVLLPTKDIAS